MHGNRKAETTAQTAGLVDVMLAVLFLSATLTGQTNPLPPKQLSCLDDTPMIACATLFVTWPQPARQCDRTIALQSTPNSAMDASQETASMSEVIERRDTMSKEESFLDPTAPGL